MWWVFEDKTSCEEIDYVALLLISSQAKAQVSAIVILLVFICNRQFAANSNFAQLFTFLEMCIEVLECTDKRAGKMRTEYKSVWAESISMQ